MIFNILHVAAHRNMGFIFKLSLLYIFAKPKISWQYDIIPLEGHRSTFNVINGNIPFSFSFVKLHIKYPSICMGKYEII